MLVVYKALSVESQSTEGQHHFIRVFRIQLVLHLSLIELKQVNLDSWRDEW